MRNIRELQAAIEYQRRRVDLMIERGMENEEFFLENRKLDQLIEQYIELEDQKRKLEMV